MYKIKEFIKWALEHIKPSSIPRGAQLPLSIERCGIEPWQYLFGSVRVQTNQATLDRYFVNHYSTQMSRARYDQLTADWDRNGYATDCQGLLDAYLTYEQGTQTDINANMNYTSWCTDKGKISDITRPFVIGEALFMQSQSSGKMSHIGWICGFVDDEPLVVEARGIAYGVVITRFSTRAWTHRGLMTKKFDYNEEPSMKTIFEYTSPMKTGEEFLAMQHALNLAGYTDNDDKKLEEDGKWGKRSQQAFDSLIAAHSPAVEPQPPVIVAPAEPDKPDFVIASTDGGKELRIFIKEA